MFQLWNLFSNVLHQRFTSWEVFSKKFSVSLLQLNLESAFILTKIIR